MIAHVLLLAAALSAGNAEFDRTAAEGAARITFARARKELVQEGPTAGVLREAMLAEPARFKTRAEAETACRAVFTNEAARLYHARCVEIRRDLALPDTFQVALAEKDFQALADRFPATFAAERKAAVDEQAKGLTRATRPTEAEFEAKDEGALRRDMTARIVAEQKTPVFEENVEYISERIVEPVLASARAERKRQTEYLMRARSDAIAPSRLTADLKARLEANVAERVRKDGVGAWGVFPSVVANALPRAVERRTVERLVAQVDRETLDVSGDEVFSVIAADPGAHVRAGDSAKLFAAMYAVRLSTAALEKIEAEAPAAERQELHAFFMEHGRDEAVQKAVEQVVRREVMPKWKAARAEAAVRQADKTWPTLGDGTWFPAPELADATAARSDYGETVKGWRRLAGMESLAAADARARVMEEATVRADERVSAAFDRARNAIAAQNAIVDRAHPVLVADLRRAPAEYKPDVKTIAETLTARTEEAWADAREKTLWPNGALPANADEQHVALFPSVRRKIELLAKTILEELTPAPPEEKKPDEPPPEETPPEDAPEEPPELELAFTLSVARKGDQVELKLLQGETPVYEKTVPPGVSPFNAAMKEIADKLGRDLLKLK